LLKGLANELSLSDQDIENISYLFSRLPLFAYLQSGINKTKSNLVPYVSTEPFLNIMDDAVKDFTELLSNPDKAERVLRDFYYKFNAQNSYKNKDKNRFKNYFTDIDFSKVGTEAATQKATQPSISVEANVILPIGTSGSGKSTFIKSLPQENLVVIEPDAMRVEFTGDINNKSKDKEIYIEAANRAIQAIKQGKQVVFDTTNLTKDKRRPFVEAIKKAIPNANIQYKLMPLDAKLAKQRIKAQLARGENRANVSDETIDRHAESYKQMLEDIKSEDITDYDTQLSTSVEEQTNDLITTPDPNIFLFDDSKDDSAAFYKKLTSTNSTVGFVYNATKFEIDNNKDLPGQGYLRLVSKDTALPFVTSLTSNFDNFSNLAADKYQSVKNYFDRKIQELKNAKDLGNKIALPKAGIGDAKKMPKELFVYLSKRLFEELGYLNPGSSAYKDITEVISNKQGISDDEILASLGFESDPFNCV
jgi:predicted kinase